MKLFLYFSVIAVFICFFAWAWQRQRRLVWRADKYSVAVRHALRESVGLDYEEGGQTLSLRAEWAGSGKNAELILYLDEMLYLPPDYTTPLSPARVTEIQIRIADALVHLKIKHSFVRMGWTSVS